MYQLGLLGYQIAYSLSPMIHQYWLSVYKIRGEYNLFDVIPDEKEKFLKNLSDLSLHGFNITIPYKEFAYEKFCNLSRRLTAINTVYKDITGQYVGVNTDVLGGLDLFNTYKQAEKVVILGNGGTARALVEIFHLLQAKEIHLIERRSKSWHPDYTLHFHNFELAPRVISTATILINTIPDLKIPLENLYPDTVVCDYTYHEKDNPFIEQALDKGCQTITGVEFLLRQAQYSFKYWFDIFPEITPELRKKLGQR